MNSQYPVLLQSLVLILKNSSLQFLCFFGVLFASGFFLTLISRWTNNSFQQFKFPNFGLYAFGAVGITLHELCHAIFAKLFFHDVKSIKWFDPTGKGGSYGTVVHSYNDHNFYHRIGLFFIGMGPVLLIPLFLLGGYHWLVPGASQFDFSILKPMESARAFGLSFLQSQNWRSIGFYLYLYFAICVTSQMELSPDDFKVARGGIFPFFVLFFVANCLAAMFKYNLHTRFLNFFKTSFFVWSGFFALALMISILNFLLCYVVLNLINRLLGSDAINPFRGS